MERKQIEDGVDVPADVAGIRAGRAGELLGVTTDTLRKILRDPESLLVRNDDGLYTLASVIKERARREAKARREPAAA
jgi:hypothetical protein